MTEEPPNPIPKVLKLMPYGFYALTSKHAEDINVMVANWITQVSFTPQLLAVGLQKTSYTYNLVEQSNVLAINLFHKGDEDVIKRFTKSRERKPDKAEGLDFTPGPETGLPILAASAAYLELKVVKIIETGGDHNIVLGEVVGAGVLKDGICADTLTLPDIGWSYAG